MTEPQITLKEALELVIFTFDEEEGWQVEEVLGDVGQNVWGSINGRKWKFTEMPKDKLKRLIKEKASPAKIFQALREIGVKL